MRENTIPSLSRFTRKKPDGSLAVEVSKDWMKEYFDYEELGAIEYLQRLKNRDQTIKPSRDDELVLFCQQCNSEVVSDENFCWYCGQRLKGGEQNADG